MKTRSYRIGEVLSLVNREWFLPSLQREFVWHVNAICALYDSLMREYPISSFLLWEVPELAREDLEVYKFIESGSDFGKHNQLDRAYGAPKLTLVLDGQQRLTSFVIGLKGTYEIKKPYARTPETQRLFLDLLRNGDEPDENGDISYGFEFRPNATNMSVGSEWFEVGKILRHETTLDVLSSEIEKKLTAYRVGEEKTSRALACLQRLHRIVFHEETILTQTESHQDQERMLEIFVRANSGGEPLSKADLLLSNLTVHWKAENAREEMKRFVDDLNASLNVGNTKAKSAIRQDFILKCCLVLLDLPIAYNISSFNRHTCERISASWFEIKTAIRDTVQLANWFGVDGATLTSANALVPIAYYLFRNPERKLRSDEAQEAINSSALRRWFIMSLLNRMFGGSSDSILKKTREAIQKHGENGRNFPVYHLDIAIKELRRQASSDPDAIRKLLDFNYGDNTTELALTLLYDERGWGTIAHHQDHIFPKQLFQADLKRYQEGCDRLGNLMLLGARENQEKSARPFHEWISSREPAFLKRHFIPEESELWNTDRFPDFFEARQRLVFARFSEVLSQTEN